MQTKNDYLVALGRMTVEYSTVEMTLLLLLSGLIGKDYDTGAIIGAQLPFNRLLDAIVALLRNRFCEALCEA